MARTKVDRFDADGNLIPMSDEELDALDARRRKLAVVLGVAGLVAVIVIALLLFQFLRVGWQGRSALEDATTFSTSQPTQINAEAIEYRLDRVSGFSWGLTSWGENFGRGKVDGTLDEGLDRLADRLTLPGDAEITTIYTNLTDARSVRRHGHLLMVRFARNTPARDFLMTEPTVFDDPAVEELRDTYWSGTTLIFYSPTGAEEDRTYQLRRFLPEFAACPKNTKPCVPAAEHVDFSDWAPRAPLSKD